jgi:hypothetical protein
MSVRLGSILIDFESLEVGKLRRGPLLILAYNLLYPHGPDLSNMNDSFCIQQIIFDPLLERPGLLVNIFNSQNGITSIKYLGSIFGENHRYACHFRGPILIIEIIIYPNGVQKTLAQTLETDE